MSCRLDREGRFKAIPITWGIQEKDTTQSIAVVVEFKILAQEEAGNWTDWSEYEDHTILGYFYVIGKTGNVIEASVKSLAVALGFSDLMDVAGPAPQRICQIVTANEEYQGKWTMKVKWLNPENYSPGLGGSSEGDIAGLQKRYGSLIRASAASADTGAVKKDKPKPPKQEEAPPAGPDVGDGDNMPF